MLDRKLLRLGPSWYDVLRDTDPNLPIDKLKKVTDPRLPQALLSIEEQQVKTFFILFSFFPANQRIQIWNIVFKRSTNERG